VTEEGEMSIITAAHDGKTYAMASDSFDASGDGWGTATAIKSIDVGGVFFGSSGTLAAVQAGMRWLQEQDLNADTREGVEGTLLGLHEFLLGHSTAPQQDSRMARITGAWWLCVGPAGIALLDTAGAVSWYEGFMAVGSGEEFAMGAMSALARIEEHRWYPIGLVQEGAVSACLYSTTCCEPVRSMGGKVARP